MGMTVAVDCPKYQEQPQLGRVVGIKKGWIIIEWLIGTYSGVWREWKKKGQNITDEVNVDNVLCGITLTKANRLCQSTIAELKDMYSKLP